MKNRKTLVACLLCSCLTGLKAQNISLFDQTSFELSGTVLIDTVIIPLELDSNVILDDIKLDSDTPFIVRLGNKNSQIFKDAIRVYMGKQQPIINLVVNMQMLNTQGTYDVIILYKVQKKTNQKLKVSLIRPAALVESGDTVHINIRGGIVREDPFLLNAEKSVSDIPVLKFSNPYFTGINNEDIVTFPQTAYEIKAGKYFKAVYNFDTNYISKIPLGKTTGKLRIMSPELNVPVIVNFEISKMRGKLWIIGTVFAGLFVGFLVRHFLKDKKELEKSRIEGFELMESIYFEMKDVTDKPFKTDVERMYNDLNAVINSAGGISYFIGGSDKVITEKIDSTKEKYNARKDEFQVLLKSQWDELKKLTVCFEDTRLSSGIKNFMQSVFLSYSNAKQFLEKNNPTDAKNEIQFTNTESNNLLDIFSTYYKSFGDLISSDSFYPNDIPEVDKVNIRNYIAEMQIHLSQIKTGDLNLTEIANSLNRADIWLESKDIIMAYLNETVLRIFKYSDSDKDTKAAKDFDSVLEEWKKTMLDISENPKRLLSPLLYMNTDLLGRFNAAWELIKPKEKGLVLGGTTEKQESNIEKISIKLRADFTPSDFETGKVMEDLRISARSAQKNWFVYALFQTILLCLLIGLATYKLYGPAFIGTFDELIVIFLVSFSIDITVENVLQLRDKAV